MNKTAFITGASRGIGKGIALRLAKAGYDIAFTYHTAENDAKELLKDIQSLGRTCKYYQASLEKKNVAEAISKDVIKDFKHIDVLICNAGKTKFTDIRTLDGDTIDFLYHLNYRSHLMMTTIFANHMIEEKIQGRIIFISSTRGIRAYDNDAVYGSLKAALNRLVQSLALELADYEITVNSIAPGAIANRQHDTMEDLKRGYIPTLVPLKRRGSPEDIAGLVEFLISKDGNYITGETIRVDGGLIIYGPKEKPKEDKS